MVTTQVNQELWRRVHPTVPAGFGAVSRAVVGAALGKRPVDCGACMIADVRPFPGTRAWSFPT